MSGKGTSGEDVLAQTVGEENDPLTVKMKTVRAGDATHYPKEGQTCRVHYEGFLQDGTKFDSSKARNAAFEFILGSGQVIKGWEQVIPKMSLGMIVQIEVPSALAYGRRGYPPIIPGEEPLKFEIELISFN